MRQKTYLTPEQQLDRTMGLAVEVFGDDQRRYGFSRFDELVFGMIVRPMRFFRVGDFVLIHFDNGAGERWKCTSISSKGFKVVEFYVKFFTEYPSHRQYSRRGRIKSYVRCERTTITRDAVICERSDQPIKLKEVFDAWSVDSTVQRINVDLLRAGAVESR